MAKEGYPYIFIPLVLAIIPIALGYWYVSIPLLFVSAFMAYFFRDPERIPPNEANIVVSPADGKVTRIHSVSPGTEGSPTLVSIFLSPLDVHINRAPISGTISNVTYANGKFLMATKEEASLVNEQNALTIHNNEISLVCKQIAGVLARRIVCWKKAGDELAIGERFGLIKFSSRTDVILPPSVTVVVHEGDRVRGGTTIIGRIAG
jgi:phosphatidylserine decarboxylase